jgi:hypothetical protein
MARLQAIIAEPSRTVPGYFWQILRVFATVSELSRTEKWCPEEDSNLHDLAIAST